MASAKKTRNAVTEMSFAVGAEMDQRLWAEMVDAQDQTRNTGEANGLSHVGRVVLSSPTTTSALAASVIVAAVLLVAHITSRGPAPTTKLHRPAAGIESINAIAISMAYQRGGMDAVDEQYDKAFAGSTYQPDRLSVETLLNELAQDSKS